MSSASRAPQVFLECERAIQADIPIVRESARDKEFAAQNWLRDRLDDAGIGYVETGRNTYPDFPLTGDPPEGFESKSLAVPGRDASYDANSQPPSGEHTGRTIFYVFIRYPKDAGNTYPVYDLVICHGDFLNPARGYIHINDNVPNFGAYGDIMIRDRKMYVVKTPYAVTDGLAEQRTLILPAGRRMPRGFMKVGEVTRHEAKEVAIAYAFDLKKSELRTISERNPNAGGAHSFAAYRTEGGDPTPVVASTQPPRRRRSR